MKRFLLISLAFVTLSSCNQDEIDRLKKENSELAEIAIKKDSSINEMLGTFNEIEDNLAEIRMREKMVEINTEVNPEDPGKFDRTQQIQEDIQMINMLLEENRKMIESLNAKLKSSELKVDEFRTMVKRLNAQIAEKNKQIADLRTQLKTKNYEVDSLTVIIDTLAIANQRQQKKIEEKIADINTAYYAYGTVDELVEAGILKLEGGFLGFGKKSLLKDDFNKEYFSKIDWTQQKSFLIYADDAKLITTHPPSSYEFKGAEDKVDSLVITSPQDFWQTSKYAVILVEQK